jgi:hypothetical protein
MGPSVEMVGSRIRKKARSRTLLVEADSLNLARSEISKAKAGFSAASANWIASRARFPIGGFAILHQAALRRRTGRAAIAAIGNSENTIATRRKHAEPRNAVDKRSGIAVKI